MKNKIIFSGVLLIVVLVFTYNYLYQDHRDIETEHAEYKTTPQNIKDEFNANALKSENKYLNKTIEISGLVTESNLKNITLNQTVFCLFDNNINLLLPVNSKLKIKGRYIGYDDLLEQVKLDQCSIIK